MPLYGRWSSYLRIELRTADCVNVGLLDLPDLNRWVQVAKIYPPAASAVNVVTGGRECPGFGRTRFHERPQQLPEKPDACERRLQDGWRQRNG